MLASGCTLAQSSVIEVQQALVRNVFYRGVKGCVQPVKPGLSGRYTNVTMSSDFTDVARICGTSELQHIFFVTQGFFREHDADAGILGASHDATAKKGCGQKLSPDYLYSSGSGQNDWLLVREKTINRERVND